MRRNLSYYCLLAPRVYVVILRAHPVRGASHNQRNTTGEVATKLSDERVLHISTVPGSVLAAACYIWSLTSCFLTSEPTCVFFAVLEPCVYFIPLVLNFLFQYTDKRIHIALLNA